MIISLVIVILLTVNVRRVLSPMVLNLGKGRSPSKNRDELITPTDRVIRSLLKKSRYLHYVPILYESSVMAKSIL